MCTHIMSLHYYSEDKLVTAMQELFSQSAFMVLSLLCVVFCVSYFLLYSVVMESTLTLQMIGFALLSGTPVLM